MNLDVIRQRSRIVSAIRAFFDDSGFVEVETPVRIAAPAPEVNIDCPEVNPPRNFGGGITYLRASPELQMKKLLSAGLDKIYQIGPCFRDGEKGSRHNPEFTMIEWYRKDATYLDILEDTKKLYNDLVSRFSGIRAEVPDSKGDGNFKEITVRQAYESWAGWDPWAEWDQDRFDFDMATKIEPALKSLGAVFLMDYPQQAASLSKIRGDVAERWEFYVDGIELANCFTELCDPEEQRRRFAEARQERIRLNEADYPVDEEFLAVLGSVRSAAGVALGVDRLVMSLLGLDDISMVRC
ncbi:MAG: EF-P lysine aminoacylase GenX [Kiritimatiellae bacterium]|nr:EF-P lysine aminoacylase GenX [Kiritimatiellia bacterium]